LRNKNWKKTFFDKESESKGLTENTEKKNCPEFAFIYENRKKGT